MKVIFNVDVRGQGKKGEDHSAAEFEMKSYCKQFKKEYGKPLIIMWQKN